MLYMDRSVRMIDFDKQDHDIIIQLSTKITTICSSIEELKADMKDIKNKPEPLFPCHVQFQKCLEKMTDIDNRIDKRPKWTQLTTVIIVLIGIVGSILTYNFNIDTTQSQQISNNKNKITVNTEKINNNHK
jgi:hypothetical protein